MIVKYWGVRGSLPSSPNPEQWADHVETLLKKFFREGYQSPAEIPQFMQAHSIPEIGGFGTHTTCVEVSTAQGQVVIDGGSGLKNLGDQMMKGACGRGQGKVHVFLTHFHWDHLLGLPFFAPHFVKGNEVHYYAVQPELEAVIRNKFQRPLFPVSFDMLGAKLSFHRLQPRQPLRIADLTVTPYQLDHPDPCWGFRVEAEGKAYAHCVDTEGTRVTSEQLGEDRPLYRNADLMYFDAQYTLPELAEKANWGHSASQLGLDIAFRENIRRVIFAHHDPGASIDQIQNLQNETQAYYDLKTQKSEGVGSVSWEFAYDGLTVKL
jgi:phosphoribosyl 1,2-cyclic phosphodiesterase